MPETFKFYSPQKLAKCTSDAEIEAVLGELDVPADPAKRTAYLHEFMGTTCQIGLGGNVGDFTPEQEYELAKLQLLAINED